MISIVAQQLEAVAGEQRDSFVVGPGPADVILASAIGGTGRLTGENVNPTRYFAARDSIRILSMGYTLPYLFGPGAAVPATFQMRGEFAGGGNFPLPGTDGNYLCTFINAEQAMGLFIDGSGITTSWCITCQWPSAGPLVSMFNVPAALVGTTQYGYMWAKVEHTLPMTNA
jgi:hypothetical protein